MDIDVVRLRPDDWRQYRTVRLEALRDAPVAFGSTLAKEQQFDEATWRSRLETGAVFVARTPDSDETEPAGLIGVFHDADGYQLVSMWVRPTARGRKVAEPLVRAVIDWVADVGGDSVSLWVTEPNDAARRLYERCGFSYTGKQAPLPSDPTGTEFRMVRFV